MKTLNNSLRMVGLLVATLLVMTVGCKPNANQSQEVSQEASQETSEVKLSLAQWSIHKKIWEGADPYQFAKIAHDLGFTGLEYVSQLYNKELEPQGYSKEAMDAFVAKNNEEAKKYGMTNVLIMIDGQGNLAVQDDAERKATVENHYKWVDAAQAMGCHAIRVNLAGSTDPEVWKPAAIDGLTQLATYAASKNINVIVENHGGLSSNADYLTEVMSAVNLPNCGTLPDFGNFCIEKSDPKDWGSACAVEFDRYDGVTKMMKYAKAVSAKSHDFNEEGIEIHTDYHKMMGIVKAAGYQGFVGVEYEGNILSEEAGIIATRDLIISVTK